MHLILKVLGGSISDKFGGYVGMLDKINPTSTTPLADLTRSQTISFRVRIADGERLILADGTTLEEQVGVVEVCGITEKRGEGVTGIGAIIYEEDSPHFIYSAGVDLPQDQFVDLLAFVRNGRIPSNIHLEIRGLRSSEPIWDQKVHPSLDIASIAFGIVLNEPTTPEHDYSSAPHNLAIGVERANAKLTWISWLLAALIAIGALISAY